MVSFRDIIRALRFPSLILPEIDTIFGRLRARYEFGTNAQISPISRIRPPDEITVGDCTIIKPHTILKPKGKDGITIGENCTIHQHSYISGEVVIGSGVRIASGVRIYSYNHGTDPETMVWKQPLNMGKIEISDDVWIGASAVVLKDVSIGSGAVIGAGSVVVDDVDANHIVAGNPAKKIGER